MLRIKYLTLFPGVESYHTITRRGRRASAARRRLRKPTYSYNFSNLRFYKIKLRIATGSEHQMFIISLSLVHLAVEEDHLEDQM